MCLMVDNTKIAIWARVIGADDNGMLPEVARYLLALDFPQQDHDRVAELSAKAQDGALTQDEREELENFIFVADLLAILQSEACIKLKTVVAAS